MAQLGAYLFTLLADKKYNDKIKENRNAYEAAFLGYLNRKVDECFSPTCKLMQDDPSELENDKRII